MQPRKEQKISMAPGVVFQIAKCLQMGQNRKVDSERCARGLHLVTCCAVMVEVGYEMGFSGCVSFVIFHVLGL